VESIAPEALMRFQTEFTLIFLTVGPLTDYAFVVMGSKVKVVETFSGGDMSISSLPSTFV